MKPEPNLFDPVVGPICWCVPNGASCCATCREKRAEVAKKPPVIFVDTGKRDTIEFLPGGNAMTDLMREADAQREKMIRDLYRAPNFNLRPGSIFTDFGDGSESVISTRRAVDGVSDYINWYIGLPPTEEELTRRIPHGWIESITAKHTVVAVDASENRRDQGMTATEAQHRLNATEKPPQSALERESFGAVLDATLELMKKSTPTAVVSICSHPRTRRAFGGGTECAVCGAWL